MNSILSDRDHTKIFEDSGFIDQRSYTIHRLIFPFRSREEGAPSFLIGSLPPIDVHPELYCEEKKAFKIMVARHGQITRLLFPLKTGKFWLSEEYKGIGYRLRDICPIFLDNKNDTPIVVLHEDRSSISNAMIKSARLSNTLLLEKSRFNDLLEAISKSDDPKRFMKEAIKNNCF